MDQVKNFQICSDLEIKDMYSESNTHLKDLIELQKATQKMYAEKHGNKNFEDMTLKDLVNFWMYNSHALKDELHEAMTAVTGMQDGNPNAWKPWKEAHKNLDQQKFSDLSERDQMDCKMEIVDMFHFAINFWISIGGTAEEMYNYYLSKNQRNWERQKNNY